MELTVNQLEAIGRIAGIPLHEPLIDQDHLDLATVLPLLWDHGGPADADPLAAITVCQERIRELADWLTPRHGTGEAIPGDLSCHWLRWLVRA